MRLREAMVTSGLNGIGISPVLVTGFAKGFGGTCPGGAS